jgi:hypothetical protein
LLRGKLLLEKETFEFFFIPFREGVEKMEVLKSKVFGGVGGILFRYVRAPCKREKINGDCWL